jgi:translation initiation factor IF-3
LNVNEEIRASRVRLIGAEGEQVGVVPIDDALKAAAAATLDLVEVSPDADPPVCKLLDYGKYKYKQKRRKHQAKTKSHVTHIKEIRLHPKTSQHDIAYRLVHAREFLAKGDKVLVSVVFSGREMAHIDSGGGLLVKVAEQMADAAKVELAAKREGRRWTMMLVALKV